VLDDKKAALVFGAVQAPLWFRAEVAEEQARPYSRNLFLRAPACPSRQISRDDGVPLHTTLSDRITTSLAKDAFVRGPYSLADMRRSPSGVFVEPADGGRKRPFHRSPIER
jgi:hypothetical protein